MAYLNGHLIIKFAMARWKLTKKTIAEDYLTVSPSRLSRSKPLKFEPGEYYKLFFDIKYQGSAATVAKENENDLLSAFRDFLIKEDCKWEAYLIYEKVKNKKAGYKEIILELLKRANVQPGNDAVEIATPQQVETPVTSGSGMSAAQMRKIFIDATEHFGIMEIINRQPAILYRSDSTKLEVFAGQIGELFIYTNKHATDDVVIFSNIKKFYEKLITQAMSIDHYMNTRFGWSDDPDDVPAFINMEEDVVPLEQQKDSRLAEIPELTSNLVSEAIDPLRLIEIAHKDWGNIRNELNLLYSEIAHVGRDDDK
jgi:hypothetical protein